MQQQPMQPQRPADGDPRLRAAAQQRFRLGNPNSIANSMAGGGMSVAQNPGMNTHPGMMNSHQRMPMGNNMMNNMPGNQQGGMGPNMQMMNQQQMHGMGQMTPQQMMQMQQQRMRMQQHQHQGMMR